MSSARRPLLVPAGLSGLGALIASGAAPESYLVQLIIWSLLNAVLAGSMRFVLLIGETNMAAGAFYGLAAYGTALSATTFNLPVVVSVPIGVFIAVAVSAVFGMITLRTKGPYFMLIGFALTEIVRLIYTRVKFVGGNSGLVGIYASAGLDPWMPTITVLSCIGVLIALFWIERSNLGLLLLAIRNNDAIVQTVGIHLLRSKILCVCIAASAAGVAGAFHAYTFHVISPDDFSFLLPVFALAYVKVGGESHLGGAIIGAALLTVVGQLLQGTGALEEILFGGVIVLTMIAAPGGIWALAGRLRAAMRRKPVQSFGRAPT
jgi:branched-chain amino acid transport system permease protein